MSLRRFELSYETFETVKRNDRFEFPQILNVEKYTHQHFNAMQKEKKEKEALDLNRAAIMEPEAANTNQQSSTAALESKGNEASKENEEEKGQQAQQAQQEQNVEVDASARKKEEKDCLDPKYDYQLCGVVIHAGVAGGGHYWSLGRTTTTKQQQHAHTTAGSEGGESGEGGEGGNATPTAKPEWYKFDDDRVTPFSEAGIGPMCFGGTEVRKTQSANNCVWCIDLFFYFSFLSRR